MSKAAREGGPSFREALAGEAQAERYSPASVPQVDNAGAKP